MFLFLMLFLGTISFGQTAMLETKTAFPNTAAAVELTVGNFTGINSLTFHIHYNPAVLSWSGMTSTALSGMTANVSDSTIHIVWTLNSGSATVSGVLCKLNFTYHGTTSVLGFLPSCYVTKPGSPNPIPMLVGYTNGSVGPDCSTLPHVTLSPAIGTPGNYPVNAVTIPITFSGFGTNTAAITQKISYDATKLSFISVSGLGNLAGATFSASNGVITIAWTSSPTSAGKDINTTGSTWMHLNFAYNGPGTAAVEFAPGCVITTGTPTLANVDVCYANGGGVTQAPTSYFATLGSLSGVIQRDNIEVPLAFPNTLGNVSGFTLYLYFDYPVMTYTGIKDLDPSLTSMVTVNTVGTMLTVVYVNPAAPIIPAGTFFKIKLHYNGMGTGHVDFLGNCQFTNNLYEPMNIEYTNGSVSPGIWPPNATVTLGSVTGNAGSEVLVPIYIDGYTSNPLGAATMFIGFDQTKLAFSGITNNIYNANYSSAGNQISIAWSDPTGKSLTGGTFLNLRFTYYGGGGSGCSSDIYFKNDNTTQQACELAHNVVPPLPAPPYVEFVPAHWINGGVNLFPASPSIVGPANPIADSYVTYSTNELTMINYNWTVTGGSVVPPNNTSSVSVHWGVAGPGTVNLSYTSPGGCNLFNTKAITILSSPGFSTIAGQVTYDNVSLQGMNGVVISLYNSMSTLVSTKVTATAGGVPGRYVFPGVPYDDYTMTVNLPTGPAVWGGVFGSDALLVELNTSGVLVPPLTGLHYTAADVNGILPVNATDALLIKLRIVGSIPSFPIGDWVFDNGIIHNFSDPTIYNFSSLCAGDVDGSYDPVVGVTKASFIATAEDEIMTVPVNKSFSYVLKSGSFTQLGAMTLFLNYDQDLFEVEKINTSLDGMEYSIKNGKVSFVWSNIVSKQIHADDAVLSLQLKAHKAIADPTSVFTIQQGSEFADPGAKILNDVNLKLAKVVTNNPANTFSIFNYPNPFMNSTTIVYELPASGYVHLVLTDLYGKQISMLVNGIQEAGMHSITFNPGSYNLASGMYLYKIEVKTGSDTFSKINKMVYTQ